MSAYALYTRHSRAELQEMMSALMADPESANPEHAAGRSIYLYTPKARKKMDAIAWAITYHLQDGQATTEAAA